MSPPAKFLLVDDRPENLLALEGLLRRDGLELVTAQSGPEALELLLRHDFALALLDVQMPGMDGFELAELMRGAGRTRHIPIVFLTAGGVDEQRRFRGYEAGAVDFLFKPIEPHILQSKANIFLELYQRRRELTEQRDQLEAAAEENRRLLEESRRAAAALQASEARSRLAQEAGGVGVWEWNVAENATYWSDIMWRIYGRAPGPEADPEALFQQSLHPDDHARVREAVRRLVAGEAPGLREQFRIRRPDGETRWIEAAGRLTRNPDGSPFCVSGVNIDVTEHVHAEEAVRESEARFRALADNMSQLAWMADAQGMIFWYNQRWFEYTGGAFEAMQGEGWRSAHHPDHLERVAAEFRRCVEAGEPWEDTFPLRRADGAYGWFLSRAVPIRDADGRIARWFGTNTDITERRRIEERLRRSEADLRELTETLEARVQERTRLLEQRNRELQQFAFIASHDFQEPLRKVQTFATLMQEEYAAVLDANAAHYLASMERAAARMSDLLRDMLAFSRVAMQARPFARVSVAALAAEVLQDLELMIAGAGAAVELEADLDLDADPSQLRQVLNHLVMNALKFSRPGVAPVATIRAASFERDGAPWRRIVVEDNGIGFDPRHAERIFEPLQRLHSHAEYPGTGMGLAICRRIAERHGGLIRAESAPGRGSRFIVELPARRPAEAAAGATPGGPGAVRP